jgi:hypothetical protein
MENKFAWFPTLVFICLSATQAFTQCPWSTKVVLGEVANGQPGLAAFKGPDGVTRLFLTWGEQGNNQLDSLVSTDGVNWTNKLVLPQFPRVYCSICDSAPFMKGGVSMTASTTCNYAYVAWMDPNHNIYAARSQYGTGWDGAYFIYGPAQATPSLRGDESSLPIGFAFPIIDRLVGGYDIQKGAFNCNFTNPHLVDTGYRCFFYGCDFIGSPPDQYQPATPTWTGANGTTELRGYGQGVNPNGYGPQPIIYEVNSGPLNVIPAGNWTDNGLEGLVNPTNGQSYLAWTCRKFSSDTCHGTPFISIWNITTGAHKLCGDWSIAKPAMAFFNGKTWIAWRGQWSDALGYINVASINPF